MQVAPIIVSELASLTAIVLSFSSIWMILGRRNRGRKVIAARLAALGETMVEISNKPLNRVAWGTAGLTAGASIHRVVSRTAAGEQQVREWAYDPSAAGRLKRFAHGIWIPIA